MRADPSNGNLRKSPKAAGEHLMRVKIEDVQKFFEGFVGLLEVRIKYGDEPGFYKHFKGVDFRGEEIVQLSIHQGRRGQFAP